MTDDIVARLRDIEGGYSFRAICRESADEIERLRAERDEARRDVCEYTALLNSRASKEDVAAKNGWDCFRDVTRKTGEVQG